MESLHKKYITVAIFSYSKKKLVPGCRKALKLKQIFRGWKGKMLFGIVIDCLLFVFLALYMAFYAPGEDELTGRIYTGNSPEAVVVSEVKEEQEGTETEQKSYIKWVDFLVTCEAMNRAYQYDIDTYGKEVHLDWISLLAYAGAKKGGSFDNESLELMDSLAEKLKKKETTLEEITADMKYYPYYYEAYSAVLGGMVGEYKIQIVDEREEEPVTKESVGTEKAESDKTKQTEATEETEENSVQSTISAHWENRYGLKAFHPIAKGFQYSDYDDFGVSRTYGYKREHLGHDMMGLIGTPIVAVESGTIEAIGWNQYGGWRIGIRSFDSKRYYYYAHLRQNWPWVKTLKEGDTIQAGDIIGYMGHTGYSKTENVNNIDEVHLHFGLQLIFDESQKDGNNQIWISCYELVKFLCRNRCEAVKDDDSGEWVRVVKTE